MVDILLATYNGEQFLEDQLNSLINQTYKDIHIYVRDDCSTDSTTATLTGYAEKYPSLFTVTDNKNKHFGAKDSFFELLKYSDAEYTMFCDQDDIWLENKIERYLNNQELHKYNNKPILMHSDLIVIDQKGRVIQNSMMKMQKLNPNYSGLNRLLAQNNITGCTVMINRALREKIKYTADALMHDWWIGLTATTFGKIIFYDKPTVLYRQHSNNEVGAKDVGSKKYIKGKLKNIDEIKSSIYKTYEQARAFQNTYGNELDDFNKVILKEYINLESKSRIGKIYSLIKNQFLKNGAIRKIGQLCLS